MISAIILAAGFSSRAGGFKMTMPIKKKVVLQYVIEAFFPICDRIYVIGGYQYEKLYPFIKEYEAKVELIINKDYEKGMFSSVQTGVREVEEGRFFVTPGDYPLITTEICVRLLEQKEEYIVPSYQNKGGHPILLPYSAREEILMMDSCDNLKTFLQHKKITYLEIADVGIIKDLDTQKDYEELCKLKEQMNE